jgi:ABC-type molybdate transport system ATPase subunit
MASTRCMMATTTIRVSLRARDVLQELTQTSGRSMRAVVEQALEQDRRQQAVVEQALEQDRRQLLLEATNAAYAALRAAPEAWAALEQERLAWEQTRAPGVEAT